MTDSPRVRARRLVGVLVVGLLVGLFGGPLLGLSASGLSAPAAAADEPRVTVDRDQLSVGDEVVVSGQGWRKGDVLEVAVCAQPDRSGAMKCADGGASNVPVLWDGSFSTTLTVGRPGGDCPCTITADSPQAPPVAVPVTLAGSPNAKLGKVPRLVVEHAEVVGVGSPASWFGAGATPTLELTLRNDGTAPASSELHLTWRNGDQDPQGVDAPAVPEIAPGQVARLEVPLTFEPMSQGRHHVEGTVQVGDLETAVEATATVVPWGLYGLGLLVLVVASALRTRWVMNQLHEAEDEPSGEDRARPEPTTPAPTPPAPRPASERERVPVTPSAAAEEPKVPAPRAPAGGRRAAPRSRAGARRGSSGPWLTRR